MAGAVIPRGVTINVAAGATLTGDGTNVMIRNAVVDYTGTIAAGSRSLVLTTSTHQIRAGDTVSISGAGGTFDGNLMAMHAEVTHVSGATITLDRPAVSTAAAQNVRTGGSDMAVTGAGTLNGANGAAKIVSATHHSRLRVSGTLTITNTGDVGGAGGLIMAFGTRNSTVGSGVTFSDHGDPVLELGAAIWIYGGSENNTITGATITGGNFGVAIDDQSTPADQYDGDSRGNRVVSSTFSTMRRGVAIEGSGNNIVSAITTTNVDFGVHVRNSTQGITQNRPARQNVVNNSSFTNAIVGLLFDGEESTQTGNTFVNCTTNIDDQEP